MKRETQLSQPTGGVSAAVPGYAARATMPPATAIPSGAGAEPINQSKWRVGQMARYLNRSCPRMLVLEVCAGKNRWGDQTYCCLSGTGTVCYHDDAGMLTLPEWLAWWERFQDEVTGKEYRECIQAAHKEFLPPPWWEDAVRNAMEPFTQS